MALSDRQILDFLSRMPFIDSAELALTLGEAHTTVHRALTGLLADGIVGRVSHGTAHLPSSQRYHLTANGIRDAAQVLGFATPPRTSCESTLCPGSGWRCSSAGWTPWPPSTVLPPPCPPAPTAFVPTWSSTEGAASTPPSPSTTAAALACPPGPGAAAVLPLRPVAGHSGVRLRPTPRHYPDPSSEHLGAEAYG